MKLIKLMLVLAMAICTTTTVPAQSKTAAKKQMEKTMVYSCPMKCEGDKTYAKPGKCPMKCEGEKMYAKGGKCPVCNMNLKNATAKNIEDHKGHNHN